MTGTMDCTDTLVSAANLAVVIIDMQDYFTSDIAPKILEDLLREQGKIIQQCAERNIPVYVFELEPDQCGETLEPLRWQVALCREATTIKKRHTSAFEETSLQELLRQQGVSSLFLMGVAASCCIVHTAADAVLLGYAVATSSKVISENFACDGTDYSRYFRKIGCQYIEGSTAFA